MSLRSRAETDQLIANVDQVVEHTMTALLTSKIDATVQAECQLQVELLMKGGVERLVRERVAVHVQAQLKLLASVYEKRE